MTNIIITPADLQNLASTFLNRLFSEVKKTQLKLEPHWDIDHLCFRVDSSESYDTYKQIFSKLGTLLTESQINGRPIATYELNQPIRYEQWLIRLIELPAPKKGKLTKIGFEHIEMVVDISLTGLARKYPSLKWDRSGLKKLYNPELELNLNLEEISLKFHNLSLKSVINFENRPKFALLVTELRLFEIFEQNEPFIAGTLPLAIDTPEADIDFIVMFSDHAQFFDICTKEFSHFPSFEITQGHMNGSDYSLCQFLHRQTPFEIFSAPKSTFQQNAFLHFQIEEKLLKYGLLDWQAEIIRLKSGGLKTEPAFTQLLKQEKLDPFAYLLELQKKSIHELREIIQTATLLN